MAPRRSRAMGGFGVEKGGVVAIHFNRGLPGWAEPQERPRSRRGMRSHHHEGDYNLSRAGCPQGLHCIAIAEFGSTLASAGAVHFLAGFPGGGEGKRKRRSQESFQ
jgi:hypothetical protein